MTLTRTRHTSVLSLKIHPILINLVMKGKLVPFAKREQYWLLQAYKDPERLIQVLVGKLLSCISNDHTVWVGGVHTFKLRQKTCRAHPAHHAVNRSEVTVLKDFFSSV